MNQLALELFNGELGLLSHLLQVFLGLSQLQLVVLDFSLETKTLVDFFSIALLKLQNKRFQFLYFNGAYLFNSHKLHAALFYNLIHFRLMPDVVVMYLLDLQLHHLFSRLIVCYHPREFPVLHLQVIAFCSRFKQFIVGLLDLACQPVNQHIPVLQF